MFLSIDSAMKKYFVAICMETFCQIRRRTDDPSTVNETCLDLQTGQIAKMKAMQRIAKILRMAVDAPRYLRDEA